MVQLVYYPSMVLQLSRPLFAPDVFLCTNDVFFLTQDSCGKLVSPVVWCLDLVILSRKSVYLVVLKISKNLLKKKKKKLITCRANVMSDSSTLRLTLFGLSPRAWLNFNIPWSKKTHFWSNITLSRKSF